LIWLVLIRLVLIRLSWPIILVMAGRFQAMTMLTAGRPRKRHARERLAYDQVKTRGTPV
jgi:hypothetical protein